MNKQVRIVYFITLLMFSQSVFSQKLNLFDLLGTLERDLPYLNAKEAENASQLHKVSSARTEYLPSLTIGHQYNYGTSNNVEGSLFPNEGTVISPSGGIHPSSHTAGVFGSYTSAAVDYKLVNFGKTSAYVDLARKEAEISSADYRNEHFQYKLLLSRSYIHFLISQRVRQAQEVNYNRSNTFYLVIKAKAEAGLRPGADTSIARAELIKAQLLLLNAQREENGAWLALRELVPLLNDSVSIDTMNIFHKVPEPLLKEETLLSNTPLSVYYNSVINAHMARENFIKRSFLPSIILSGAVWARGSGISNKTNEYQTTFSNGTRYQVFNYLAGISIRWNLLSMTKLTHDLKSQQYLTEKNKNLYQHQLLKQDKKLKDAQQQLQLSLLQTSLAPVQYSAALNALQQSEARYASGLADIATYYQSLISANNALLDFYITYATSWQSLLSLAESTGDFSVFTDQIK